LPDRGVGASGVQQGPPIVQIIVGTRPLVAVDRGRQPVWTMGLARSGEGGAIMPEVERVRTRLPIPDPTFDGDVPFDARDPRAVFPPIEPLLPPEGAPNVLIVLLDDVGFAASSAFGGPRRRDAGEARRAQGAAPRRGPAVQRAAAR